MEIKWDYPCTQITPLNLSKAESLKPLLYPTRNFYEFALHYLPKPSYLFGSFFSFLSLGSFLGFLTSLLPFFSLDISITQLGYPSKLPHSAISKSGRSLPDILWKQEGKHCTFTLLITMIHRYLILLWIWLTTTQNFRYFVTISNWDFNFEIQFCCVNSLYQYNHIGIIFDLWKDT